MNKILISFTVGLLSIFLTSCDNGYNHHHCNRLSCIPNTAVSVAVPNSGQTVIHANGGINGIIVYQVGNTYRAYDLQDPDKCASEENSKLSLSDDDRFLMSDSGEQFFLQNGQPTKGISCRQLIRYHVSISGQIIDISN